MKIKAYTVVIVECTLEDFGHAPVNQRWKYLYCWHYFPLYLSAGEALAHAPTDCNAVFAIVDDEFTSVRTVEIEIDLPEVIDDALRVNLLWESNYAVSRPEDVVTCVKQTSEPAASAHSGRIKTHVRSYHPLKITPLELLAFQSED